MFKLVIILLLSCAVLSCAQIDNINKSSTGTTTSLGSDNNFKINIDAKKYTLDNGLKVIIYENHRLPIFSYHTFFNVGGRYESKGTTGATHFLEHMMFKGAKKYGPGKFDTTLEGRGGTTNAYTTFDSTVYYEDLPSDAINILIDMEADRMENLLLDPVAYEKERKVILEERKYRYENSPQGYLYLKMMQAVFRKTPYGGSVIGSEKDVKDLKRDQMMTFFKKFYVPNNATIVIAGDVDPAETINEIKKKFGKISPSTGLADIQKKMDIPKRYVHQGKYFREIKLNGHATVPIFMMSYKGKKLGDRTAFAMDILASILGDGASSHLNKKYVYSKRPKLSSINVSNYTLLHNGVFFISGELLKGTNLKRFKRSIIRETKRMCDTSINERSLVKTKNQYMYDYYTSLQTNSGVASFLGLRELMFNDFNYYKKELEIYNSIKVDELKKVCHQIFDRGENIFLSVWNKHPIKK